MTFPLIKTEISIDKSFLNIYTFNHTDKELLLKSCTEGIKDNLNVSSHRQLAFFSDDYDGIYYYGKWALTKSQRLTPALGTMLQLINDYFNADCNGIIVNRYEDGSNYIINHRDSKNHSDAGVFLISYGTKRNFRVFSKVDGTLIKNVDLNHGELLHMGGDFQAEFEHDVEQDVQIKN